MDKSAEIDLGEVSCAELYTGITCWCKQKTVEVENFKYVVIRRKIFREKKYGRKLTCVELKTIQSDMSRLGRRKLGSTKKDSENHKIEKSGWTIRDANLKLEEIAIVKIRDFMWQWNWFFAIEAKLINFSRLKQAHNFKISSAQIKLNSAPIFELKWAEKTGQKWTWAELSVKTSELSNSQIIISTQLLKNISKRSRNLKLISAERDY